MKQRSVYSEIWKDEKFVNLSKSAMILALYCMTNPSMKLICAYMITDREILFDTNLTVKELKSAKEEIKIIGLFFLENYCVLKTEFAVFKFKGPHLKKAISSFLEELPENVLQLVNSDTLSIPYTHPIHRVGNSNSNSNSNSSNSNSKGVKNETNEADTRELQKVIAAYNTSFRKNIKSSEAFKANFADWRKVHELPYIISAIRKAAMH